MNKVTFALTLGLVACGGLTQDEAETELLEIICDKTFECAGETTLGFLPWADAEECKDAETTFTTTTTTTTTCDFDSKLAQDCIDEYEALSCEEFIAGDFPAVCNEVCGTTTTGTTAG